MAEHLWFYSQLKGQGKGGKEGQEELEEESDRMITDLGIPHKRDEMSKNLSGGMQRKLSIACAFVGGSKWVYKYLCEQYTLSSISQGCCAGWAHGGCGSLLEAGHLGTAD